MIVFTNARNFSSFLGYPKALSLVKVSLFPPERVGGDIDFLLGMFYANVCKVLFLKTYVFMQIRCCMVRGWLPWFGGFGLEAGVMDVHGKSKSKSDC